MKTNGKTTLILIILWAIILFGLGFFAGSTYKQHQIKKSVQEVFSWFWSESLNSKSNKNEEKIEVIPQKWSYTFEKNDTEMKISIYEAFDAWKNYSDGWDTFTAKNNFIVVRIAWENVGNKPAFKSLSQYNLLLETADGKQYRPTDVKQVWWDNRPEGYGGCVSCESNPWEKNVQDAIFDINESLDWAKVILEDDNIAFEL